MPNLMICITDNRAVHFEGAGTYYFIDSLGMYFKVKCMAVLNMELKHFRPVAYMDETNVKAFDTCGSSPNRAVEGDNP